MNKKSLFSSSTLILALVAACADSAPPVAVDGYGGGVEGAALELVEEVAPVPDESITIGSGPMTANTSYDVAELLVDPTFFGLVPITVEGKWTLYFDKSSEMMVATDGESSIVFDPSDAENSREHLEAIGIPAALASVWEGRACRAACWGAAGGLAVAVTSTCALGTTVSVGGMAIPCTVLLSAAGAGLSAAASVCGDWCTSQFDE